MPRFHTVLVPFDLSARARRAVRERAAIAGRFDARLLLLHVETTLDGDYQGDEIRGEQGAYEAGELAHLAQSIAPDAPVEFLSRRGDVAGAIAEVCREKDVDLIVMPTRGQGPYRRFLMGSTTAKVLHDAWCPVLTVTQPDAESEGAPGYRRIACLADLKGDSRHLLRVARELADFYEADLMAIHLTPPFRLDPGANADFLNVVKGSARLSLERALEEAGVDARVVVCGGDAETCLPSLLGAHQIDLLVLCRNAAAPFRASDGLSAEAYAAIRSAPCSVLSL